eukprot:gene2178-17769_t
MSKNLRTNIKKHGGIETIRENARNEAQYDRRNKLFNHLFLKRTKLHYGDDIEHNGDEIFTAEDVRTLTKSLKKKSDKTEDILKGLTKAFIFLPAHVNIFLEEENSLWTLVSYLTGKDSKLQIYACYCITNVTSADHGKGETIAKMCAPYLIAYLSSSDALKQDLCATALGNLAADGQQLRDLLKTQGILKPLVELFRVQSAAVIESACFAAMQLAAGSGDIIAELHTMGIGELLVKCLKRPDIQKVHENIAWLLVYIAPNETHTRSLVEFGLLDIVINKLQHICNAIKENLNGVTAFVRLLGNCAAVVSEPAIIKSFESGNLFKALTQLVSCNHTHIVKESLWVLSNIMSIREEMALDAVDNGIIMHLSRCLNYGENIQLQAVKCLCALSSYGDSCIKAVASLNVLEFFIECLQSDNIELKHLAIQFIEMVLRLHDYGQELLMERNIISVLEKMMESDTFPKVNDAECYWFRDMESATILYTSQ